MHDPLLYGTGRQWFNGAGPEKSGQEPAPVGAARIQVAVPVHATLKTLREALWFEVNPPLKDSAQKNPEALWSL